MREPLATHCQAVAETASRFAAAFGAQAAARLIGLLHDLGKYADRFQARLDDPSRRAGDHSLPGAALLALALKLDQRCLIPFAAIRGHHGGLDRLPSIGADIGARIEALHKRPERHTDGDLARLRERFGADGLGVPTPTPELIPSGQYGADDMLDTRMLFSVLVDADFLETEAHFAGDAQAPRRPRQAGPGLEPDRDLDRLKARIADRAEQARRDGADDDVLAMRARLLDACLTAGTGPVGAYTLTAPTGSGKTLAMLAFALRHAIEHGLRRVVLVMPFLNIIDQTAREYRRVFDPAEGFDDHYVLEDHSLADASLGGRDRGANGAVSPPEPEDACAAADRLRRLLAENWDAPMVLTSHVRCLESLMANRPSDCRKLHRLARSVILFDEVQTLPPQLAPATLATLSRLVTRFGSTVVFASATQPAFESIPTPEPALSAKPWTPREIVPSGVRASTFARAADRTRMRWDIGSPTSLEEIARRIRGEPAEQALCIVNLKDQAQHLARSLHEDGTHGVAHLSTSMCPAHREAVLGDVARRLDAGEPVRLISTQCVEAGVDLDFPVVYRALAPLDAIAQAAGRCNRHGRRPDAGLVHVFLPASEAGKQPWPPGYGQAVDATLSYLRLLADKHGGLDDVPIIQDPDRLAAYYRHLYVLSGAGKGGSAKEKGLDGAIQACDFEDVARQYRLIEQDTINVIVPYRTNDAAALVGERVDREPREPGFLREWFRRARPHTIGVYRPKADSPTWSVFEPLQLHPARRPVGREDNWYSLTTEGQYDPLLGVVPPGDATAYQV